MLNYDLVSWAKLQTWHLRRISFRTSFCWSRVKSWKVLTNTLAFSSKLIPFSVTRNRSDKRHCRFHCKFLYVNKSKSRHWARGTSQSCGVVEEKRRRPWGRGCGVMVSSFSTQFKMADEFQWRLFTNNLKITVFINYSESIETEGPCNCVKSEGIWILFSTTFHRSRCYNSSVCMLWLEAFLYGILDIIIGDF